MDITSKAPLRVGIVGAGFIAHFHLRALKSVRGVTVTSVLKRGSAEGLAHLSRELGLGDPEIVPSITAMARQVDVICLFAPNFTQVPAMEEIGAACKAGARLKAVISEKPLGRNLREARRMAEIAKEHKLLTAYFENQIHMKAVKAQREQLAGVMKRQGPLTLARSAEEHAGPHMPWFWDPTKQGGGVLLDMGCHSIAVGWYMLLAAGAKDFSGLVPQRASCELGLLKWGKSPWREQLMERHGVDYRVNPAEDFAAGQIVFKHADTGAQALLQFTDSWMYDFQGLRLSMDGLGAGYGFEINTQKSPLSIFIGDNASKSSGVSDQELALEKSLASTGLLTIIPNEVDLYGYIDEWQDAVENFSRGRDGFLSFSFGVEITKLLMACYMAHERKSSVDLTDARINSELETFVPMVQKGLGAELFPN